MIGTLEKLILSRTPLVVVAPNIAADVLATLEVNTIRQTMRLLAVICDEPNLRTVATACQAMIMDRSDRQSGYLAPGSSRPLRALDQYRHIQPPDHDRGDDERIRVTAESASTTAATTDRHTGGWGYAAALTPIIFGTTYVLTTEFLPPGRPLLAALMRSLPTGLVLIIGSPIPPRRWMARFFVLSVLYASGLFPLLFIAAYRLPGGVAAVINSLSPLIVVVISVPLLGSRIRPIQIVAGIVGTLGVALLVLRSDARLDVVGLVAMAVAAIMFSVATVLTKRWGLPEGMTSIGVTGWTFLLAGLTLLPATLLIEGLPDDLTARNIGGLIYLVLISGILAYALWFWGLQRLSASAVTFLTLLNPVVAALLGWVVLDQRFNLWQALGAVLVLVSVVLGQPGAFDRLRGRSALASPV